MKRFFYIVLRYIALVALYMLITWGLLEIFGTFHFWRVLIMGCIFCAIVLALSEWKNNRKYNIYLRKKLKNSV